MFSRINSYANSSKILQETRKNVPRMSTLKEVLIFVALYLSVLLIHATSEFFVSTSSNPAIVGHVLLLTLFLYSVRAMLYIFIVTKIEKRSLMSIGITKENALASILKGLIIGFLMFLAVVVLGILLGSYAYKGFNSSQLYLIIPFLLAFFVQSLTEEIQYRGWIMTYFSKRHSIFIGFIISDLMFVLMHMGNNGIDIIAMINLFIAGLFYTILFWKYDNIWVCGLVHTMWNFAQGCLFGFNVSGIQFPSLFLFKQDSLSIIGGGTFGPESSLIAIFVFMLATLLTLYYPKKS